jgi:A/G-specific adenine glycosylase
MTKPHSLHPLLLAWYDQYQRQLPWRAVAPTPPNPYHVWLSEIMLQQTTVATVISYFLRFIERFPTVEDLANAPLDEVLVYWQGLGYYSRARNLHKCAQIIVNEYQGILPEEVKALQKLPGIGVYTAAAIASIAFNKPTVPIDGNVIRVLSRVKGIQEPYPSSLKQIEHEAQKLSHTLRPGDFAQALMDLGATVCTPQSPKCSQCPWSSNCYALAHDMVLALPKKKEKPKLPTRHTVAFLAVTQNGQILLRRRPAKGILAGMMEVPLAPFEESPLAEKEALRHQPLALRWEQLSTQVRHTFTHFHLEIKILKASCPQPMTEGLWASLEKLHDYALPTLMKKVLAAGLATFKQD